MIEQCTHSGPDGQPLREGQVISLVPIENGVCLITHDHDHGVEKLHYLNGVAVKYTPYTDRNGIAYAIGRFFNSLLQQ